MKINIGTDFESSELVVIEMTEGMAHAKELAMQMAELIKNENYRRVRFGKPLVGYKIETSGELLEQYPEVAQGKFSFVHDDETYEEMDMGIIFPSNEIGRENG